MPPRELAARVEEAASAADTRFPPREPAEPAQEAMLETEPEAETEQSGIAAAEGPHDRSAGRQVRPSR